MAEQLDQAVVPPTAKPIVETVSAGRSDPRGDVASVNLDYDPNFKTVVQNFQNRTPEGDLKIADIFKERTAKAEQEHVNERFQPGAFLVGLLRGRVDDMYSAFNGGKTYAEKGRDALGNIVWVEKNQRGFNGRMYAEGSNKELSKEEVSAINKTRGGVITASDKDALQTADWSSAYQAAIEAKNGDTSQLNATRKAAFAAANEGNAANKNIDDEIHLAGKLKPVLNYVSTLDPKQRQILLGYAQRYRNGSANLQRSGEKAGSVSATNQQQLGGGFGPIGNQVPPNQPSGQGAVPPSANLNASLGGSQTTSQNERNAENINRENSIQEMQTAQTAIMQQLQGVIKDPVQFQEFMKLIALNQSNNDSLQKLPPEFMPPGFQKIAPTDLFTGGADSIIENRYAQQANNGLIAAYQADLYKAQRKSIEEGKTITVEDVYKNFEKSDVYQGLVNYAKDRIHTFTGRGEPLQRGAKVYNKKTGKIEIYGE